MCALFGIALALVAASVVVPLFPGIEGLHEGERAPRTIEAGRDAQYESVALTNAARDEAAHAVAEVALPPDASVKIQQVAILTRLLEQVRLIRLRTDLTQQQQFDEITNLAATATLSTSGRVNLLLMDKATFDAFPQRSAKALAEVLDKGVRAEGANRAVDEFFSVPANVPDRSTELTALRELLRVLVVPNVQVDEAATQRRRAEARNNVSPVVASYTSGQVVVREGETFGADDIEALRRTGIIDDTFNYLDAAAGGLVALSFGVGLAILCYQLQPFSRPASRRMIVVTLAIALIFAMVRLLLPQVSPDTAHRGYAFAIPVAAAGMVVASFAELSFAAVVAAAMSFLAAFIAATTPELAGAQFVSALEPLELVMAFAAGGLAGASFVHRAERLSRFAASAIPVAIATWVVLFAFWLLGEPRSNENLGWLTLAAAIAGVGSAAITLAVFVLLSFALGITTRLQLLELAQADHPLLHRLQEEAPGTFHHSMMVGSLAERAAQSIGADALMAKVGSYYHDVGKLAQPNHYIENMLDAAANPHDALPSSASAGIIREHVTNGLDIARRHRLPPAVRLFIPEHHGTRLVTYFYRRALEAGETPEAERFRYTGPRPSTKESAIVMLADSCEAVVRARHDRTLRDIEGLVDGIFAERLAEGQLDECDITMRELQQVARSFKSTLRAVYHPRIEYPQPSAEELAAIAGGV